MASLILSMSAACKDRQTANTIGPLIVLFMQLFCGFLISFDQIPSYLAWLEYVSIFKYGFQALIQVSTFILVINM
jgi:ABC-type multidrug transport system permease subunit